MANVCVSLTALGCRVHYTLLKQNTVSLLHSQILDLWIQLTVSRKAWILNLQRPFHWWSLFPMQYSITTTLAFALYWAFKVIHGPGIMEMYGLYENTAEADMWDLSIHWVWGWGWRYLETNIPEMPKDGCS